MSLTLTIGKNPTGKPSTINLTIDNPHLLILGSTGAGKTVMCEHITNINEGTEFVYLGRDERGNELRQARPFRAVAEDNFFTHPLRTHTVSSKMHAALISTLDAAATRAIERGAVLIIEETTLYLEADRTHFFNTVGDLQAAGVHIIFTDLNIHDKRALRRLAIGNIALLKDHLPVRSPINQVYPELAAHAYPTARRGEFILRTPSGFDIATHVVPSPR